MTSEIWLPAVGFEDLYEVSNFGRIRGKTRQVPCGNDATRTQVGVEIKTRLSTTGYPFTPLRKGGKTINSTVHRLVAKTFLPQPSGKNVVNHIDCDPTNNHVSNLEWVTPKENSQHAAKLGRLAKPLGDANPQTKLRSDVRAKIASPLPRRSGERRDGLELSCHAP